ncbi:hypothetical protein B0T17DRAFT_517386 [Bombardia bombarda]|uniref:DUF6594 domain-containing protein n=1 Tax=Bombardia bombarda TaxID=252184 RepID=A0AA39XM85_9PEZI|nr:hypothetical protein B0T17DRAFT_517386 [Bombardia bombarda]
MVQNNPSDPVQRDFWIDDDYDGGRVQASLTGVCHGHYEERTDDKATLLTFRVRFEPKKRGFRFKRASITVVFSSEAKFDAATDGIVVKDFAPAGLYTVESYDNTEQTVNNHYASSGFQAGLQLGGVGHEFTRTYERRLGAKINGMSVLRGRNYGGANAIEWTLSEDEVAKTGVPEHIEVAVLLGRYDQERFKAAVAVAVDPSSGFQWLRNRLHRQRTVDPVLFDPCLEPQGEAAWVRESSVDPRNLGEIDLQSLVNICPIVAPIIPWSAKLQVSGPTAENDMDVEGYGIAHPGSPTGAGLTLAQLDAGTTVEERLFQMAQGMYEPAWYKFKRFDSLQLLNLYHYQHKLVVFDEKISQNQGKMSEEEITTMAALLKEYYEAIKAFKDISQMQRPEPTTLEVAAQTFADVIGTGDKGQHYKTASDALHMIDLSPKALGVPADMIRVLLERKFGRGDGEENRAQQKKAAVRKNNNSTPRGASASFEIAGSNVGAEISYSWYREENYTEERRPPGKPQSSGIRISPQIDAATRILVALGGGAFLLAPMYALTYIQVQKYQLITITLFVIVFAVTLATTSKASNQELLAATAAYAAVLVVFISQSPAPPDATA